MSLLSQMVTTSDTSQLAACHKADSAHHQDAVSDLAHSGLILSLSFWSSPERRHITVPAAACHRWWQAEVAGVWQWWSCCAMMKKYIPRT